MKTKILTLLFLILLTGGLAQESRADEGTKLLRTPDISSTQIVFVYAGDLWIVDRAGGQARRLTSYPGLESFPRFSPDGQWVAFSAAYDGNTDVYVIPAIGGQPRRLTFHPSADYVLDWSPDGKKILFRSARVSAPSRFSRYFTVNLDGKGLPELLPIPHGGPASYSPDGNSLAYSPRAREMRTWKRYRGGRTDYVAIFNLQDESYRELPRADANDFWPMWAPGAIYFASDRDRHLNLWRYDLQSEELRQLTHFSEYDLKYPSLGPDAIVFQNGGELHVLDLATENESKVVVEVRGELLIARTKRKSVKDEVRTASLSPNAKRVVFEARGELFTVPAENGPTRQLTHTSGIFERDPVWSPDGEHIAYFSDRGGEWAIYLQSRTGEDETKLLDSKDKAYPTGLIWSPDSEKLLYTDQRARLWCVNVEKKSRELVDSSPAREGVGQASWSPDSRWVCYAKSENYSNKDIWLWSYESKKNTRVSTSFYGDFEPTFDLNGKYLYFGSRRNFYPSTDVFDWHFSYYLNNGLFCVVLDASAPSPFAPKNDEEKPKDEDEAEAKKNSKDEKENGAKEETPKTVIDLDGIGERIVPLPVPAGNYRHLTAGEGKLFYLSEDFRSEQAGRPDAPKGSKLLLFDMEERESAEVLHGVDGFEIDAKGKKLLVVGPGRSFSIVDAAKDQKAGDGALDLSGLVTTIDYREEWPQIFHEAWRIERDFFWDPGMGGKDWEAIGKRYEKLLPWVAHRSDLNYLIGELIGELATSHTYVGGGDYPQVPRVGVGLLGVDFVPGEGYWRISKIYQGEDWDKNRVSPLQAPGLKVSEGDYLIAVDGVEVPVQDNPYSHFQGMANQEITLLVNDKPARKGAHEVLVKAIGDESGLRYHDWVESNRRRVSEATDGKVGYMHVPNTSIAGLREFDKYLQAQTLEKALIVDERYNAGGMIPDFYTNKLKKRLLNFIAPRNGKDMPWPPNTLFGPKVLLVNEFAGSGGDCFPWYFQQEKIGPVIGMRTWGGLVGYSRLIPMLDGGRVTAPEIAFWSPQNGGEWIVENHGVDPDIEVDNRPDLVAKGADPQLEKAIEVITKELARQKPLPKRPPYPRGR